MKVNYHINYIDKARGLNIIFFGNISSEQAMSKKIVSIVVPVFNEESAIDIFLKKICTHLKDIACDFEIIFVNDGSSDGTLEELLKAKEKYTVSLKIINLSRNFGKEAALTAGLDYAIGDAVIPMDIDLQDPPELLHDMIAKWNEGYDVVLARRKSRRKDSCLKRMTSTMFYKLWNAISDISIPEDVGDFRLMDKRVVEAVKDMPERTRFMKGIFSWVGFKTTTIAFDRQERSAGTSAWSYSKLCTLAVDGVLAFSTAPLKIWFYLGLAVLLATICWALKVSVYANPMTDYELNTLIVLVIGGLNMTCMGVIGHYLAKIYKEVKARPIYVVKSTYPDPDQ